MFKSENFEQELMQEMKKNLVANEIENRWSFDKISKAADYIGAAAEIFDDNGMHKEAEILTRMLEKLASESENKMVSNMKATGTPFSMKEFHSKDRNHLDEIDMSDEDDGDDFEDEEI